MGQGGPPETPQNASVERNGRALLCGEAGAGMWDKGRGVQASFGGQWPAWGGGHSGRSYGEGQAALRRKVLSVSHSLDFTGNEFLQRHQPDSGPCRADVGGICSGQVVGCESQGQVLGWGARKWKELTGDTHGGQAKWLSG